MPALLGELWAALGRDPLLAAECPARPVVAERELRWWFEERGARSRRRRGARFIAARSTQVYTSARFK